MYKVTVWNDGKPGNVMWERRADVIAGLLQIDLGEFEWAIENEGRCDGFNPDGKPVSVEAMVWDDAKSEWKRTAE